MASKSSSPLNTLSSKASVTQIPASFNLSLHFLLSRRLWMASGELRNVIFPPARFLKSPRLILNLSARWLNSSRLLLSQRGGSIFKKISLPFKSSGIHCCSLNVFQSQKASSTSAALAPSSRYKVRFVSGFPSKTACLILSAWRSSRFRRHRSPVH